MKSIDPLLWFEVLNFQQTQLKQIELMLKKIALSSHSLVFSGITGIGKKAGAVYLAMAANCSQVIKQIDSKPCTHCRSCKKIIAGTHPDIVIIKPDNGLIKISVIRELGKILVYKQNEARVRVVIICDAHKMNKEAANALLKMLEEPPAGTWFVLTVTERLDLIPTIVSRCLHIRFYPISVEYLIKILVEKYKEPLETAKIIAPFASGSLEKAVFMAGNNWVDLRHNLITELDMLLNSSVVEQLVFTEKLSGKNFSDYMEIIKIYLRDLVVVKYHKEMLVFDELKDKIDISSKTKNVESLISYIYAVERILQMSEKNFNNRLMLDALVLEKSKCLQSEKLQAVSVNPCSNN